MKKAINLNLKSNQGFTIQDLAVAIMILILFAGTIGGIYISILTVQAETKKVTFVTETNDICHFPFPQKSGIISSTAKKQYKNHSK